MDWKKKAETLDEIAGYFELCSLNADPTGKAKKKFLQYISDLQSLSGILRDVSDGKIVKHVDGQIVLHNYDYYARHRWEWAKDGIEEM